MKPKLTSEQIKARKYKFGGLVIIAAAVIGFLEWYVQAPDSTGAVGQPSAEVYEAQLENQLKSDESIIAVQKAIIAKDEQKADAK